jgi:uncharacterized protein
MSFAAAVLLYIGVRMIRDLLQCTPGGLSKAESEKRFQEMVKRYRHAGKKVGEEDPAHGSAVKLTHRNFRRFGYTFYDEQFDVSTWGIFFISLIVGVVGGIGELIDEEL